MNTILGGDMRLYYTWEKLNSKYKDFIILNSENTAFEQKDEYIEQIKSSEFVILPAPLTTDGKTLRGFEVLTLEDVSNLIDDSKVIKYQNDEKYVSYMAYLTAEGAVGDLLLNYNQALSGKRITITGYGRIAKYLIDILTRFNCQITVVLRNMSKFDNLRHGNINKITFDSIESVILSSDIIINTVPEEVISDEILDKLSDDVYLMELASKPGGFDYESAQKHRYKAVRLSGLPGKCAPKSAGIFIADIISENIEKIRKERCK